MDWQEYATLPKRRMWFRPLARQHVVQPFKLISEHLSHSNKLSIFFWKRKPITTRKKRALGVFAEVLSLRLDMTTSKQWLQIALLHMRAHRWDAALDSLEIATEYKKILPDVFYWRGICFLQQKSETSAQEAFEMCLQNVKDGSPLFQLCHNELSNLNTKKNS